MTIREKQEEWEKQYLSPFASLSADSLGRDREEPQCDIRPVYQRDRDRILHSKAFRRLKDKTQVFLPPLGDHYRTRLTHTLEVSQNARTIAKALRLNEDLVEAIALGHDLGHTPFGHCGEQALNSVCSRGFRHNEQSVRIVERLEKGGRGLNLTKEVRDGIRNHQTAGSRLNTLIHDIVENSEGKNEIQMSEPVGKAMKELRKFMFIHVYKNPGAKSEEEKAKHLVITLYEYYRNHVKELPEEYQQLIDKGEEEEQVVCDYVAGMSDRYAIEVFQQLYMPRQWRIV